MVVAHCERAIPEVKKYIDIGREMVYNRGIRRTVSNGQDDREGKTMGMTKEQAKEIHDKVMVVVEHLIDCLTKHQTPTKIGEMALVLLAGTSAGTEMRPLTDVTIPTLPACWPPAVDQWP